MKMLLIDQKNLEIVYEIEAGFRTFDLQLMSKVLATCLSIHLDLNNIIKGRRKKKKEKNIDFGEIIYFSFFLNYSQDFRHWRFGFLSINPTDS